MPMPHYLQPQRNRPMHKYHYPMLRRDHHEHKGELPTASELFTLYWGIFWIPDSALLLTGNAVHCTSFGIVTKSNPVITIRGRTVTDSHAFEYLEMSHDHRWLRLYITFTFIIWTRCYIRTSTIATLSSVSDLAPWPIATGNELH